MELVLNLEWMVMAAALCWLWVRHTRRERRGLFTQIVSLTLVLVMMFVVITMYDDMAMAQSPAEIRCFQREDDLGAHAHVPLHPAVALAPPLALELPFNTLQSAVVGNMIIPTVDLPFLSSVQNRPPPAAHSR
jgi:hypothetical protein